VPRATSVCGGIFIGSAGPSGGHSLRPVRRDDGSSLLWAANRTPVAELSVVGLNKADPIGCVPLEEAWPVVLQFTVHLVGV